MKLRPHMDQTHLTQPMISKHEVVHESEKTRADVYVHPWYQHVNKPNPPTPEAVKRAKFVDKTHQWQQKKRLT